MTDLPLRRARPQRPGGRTAAVSARIAQATLDLLKARGYEGLSLSEVAERAGINRSTLYRRWPTKAALVLETLAVRVAQPLDLAEGDSFRARFAVALRSLSAFLGSPLGRAALTAALQIERTKEVAALWRRLWRERLAAVDPLFEQAIARGEIAPDIDREAVFSALAGAIYFRLIVSGQRADDAWIGRLLDAVLGPG